MKKDERKSHLRPGNKVSYFTYEDLDIIPNVIDQTKNYIDTGYIFKLNILQNKIESNYRKYEKVREQSRINKRRRKKKLLQEKELNKEENNE